MVWITGVDVFGVGWTIGFGIVEISVPLIS